jgi:hypothetical protein
MWPNDRATERLNLVPIAGEGSRHPDHAPRKSNPPNAQVESNAAYTLSADHR